MRNVWSEIEDGSQKISDGSFRLGGVDVVVHSRVYRQLRIPVEFQCFGHCRNLILRCLKGNK